MSARSERVFVDTNVLVYAHDSSAGGKHQRARELVEQLWATGGGCLSVQVLQELYVILTRKVATPLPADTARQILSGISRWRVHAPGPDDVLAAVDIHARLGISFWDAMVVQSAARLGCKRILTEDLAPGSVYQGVLAVDPFVPDSPGVGHAACVR
jgi:predicted nucleic acid-binding protein